jgi:hypothetical protein
MRKRPMSTLIFGILNIGWAILNALALLMNLITARLKLPTTPGMEAVKSDPTFAALTKFGMCAGVVLGLALLAFGIGLLLLKNWARLGSIIYGVITIVYTPVVSLLMWPYTKRMMEQTPNMPPGMAAGMAMLVLGLSLLFGMAYPALLIYYMTRTNVIEACQPEQTPPQG